MPLKNDVLFIHVPKTGGTSITEAMGIPLGVSDESVYYHDVKKMQHWQAERLHNEGIMYDKVFTVARDPVERMASTWHFGYNVWLNHAGRRQIPPRHWFKQQAQGHQKTGGFSYLFSSASFLLEGLTNLRILNFRTLQYDWERMVDEWELPWNPKLKRRQKSKSRGNIKFSYTDRTDLHQIYKEDYKFYAKHNIDFAK